MTRGERATRMLHAVADPIAALPYKFNEWLAKLPTTPFRILGTMVAVAITTIRYALSTPERPWQPSIEWLAFLATMAGIDTVQFVQKRKTQWKQDDKPSAEVPQP